MNALKIVFSGLAGFRLRHVPGHYTTGGHRLASAAGPWLHLRRPGLSTKRNDQVFRVRDDLSLSIVLLGSLGRILTSGPASREISDNSFGLSGQGDHHGRAVAEARFDIQ